MSKVRLVFLKCLECSTQGVSLEAEAETLVANWTGTRKQVFSSFCVQKPTNFSPRPILLPNPHMHICVYSYRVPMISRLLQIIGLFCRISSLLQGSFAKETQKFQQPTNCRPIGSWNVQETWDSDLFWFVTVESVGFSLHFSFWRHVPRLATFSIVSKYCIF